MDFYLNDFSFFFFSPGVKTKDTANASDNNFFFCYRKM